MTMKDDARSKGWQSSKHLDAAKKPEVEEDANLSYNQIGYVRVQSLYTARLSYNGLKTGKLYEWMKAGDIVEVDERDATYLLEKRLGSRSCCGGSTERAPIFRIVN